jgi:amino acid transporter
MMNLQGSGAIALIRGIGRWDFVALFINSIVGAGIFGLPSRVHALIGAYSIFAYLLCAALVLCIVFCFAEIGSRFAATGGPYLYATEAFGPQVGFQVGWLVWLARITAFAALGNLLIDYLGYFLPQAAQPAVRATVISALVAVLTLLNLLGVRQGAVVADIFTVGKLVPMTLFVVVGLFFIEPANLRLPAQVDHGSFSAAMLLLVFAFTGFEAAVIPAAEIHDPQRTVPFGAIVSMLVIAPLYILIQVVCTGTLPGLAASSRPLADAAGAFIGPAGGALMAITALVSVTGTLNGIVLAAPRLLFAMAERRQLPAPLAAVHERFRTPHVAIIVTSLVILVVTLAGSFVTTVAIATLTRLIAFAVTCAAVPVMRRRGVEAPTFRVPGGTVTVAIALVLIAWLVLSSSMREAISVAVAMAVGLGIMLVVRGRE